ncbi:hypothetical protein LTR86_004868 [Recurvomyces mirabilis]|nr:hypothetical protein LTR86_004868 [Recurvomyces mirabilis]
MCLVKVKEEEEYPTPARYKRVTRVRRYEDDPPPRVERSSYYREEHRAPPPPAIVAPPPAPSTYVAETVRSRRTSRAPTARAPSVTRSHYVEVDEEAPSRSTSPSSASSVSDVRSRATSHRTRKPPASEYSIHEREREVRRERAVSRPREEYETYRYVNAPPERQSRDSYPRDPRERERITIEDKHGGNRTRVEVRR